MHHELQSARSRAMRELENRDHIDEVYKPPPHRRRREKQFDLLDIRTLGKFFRKYIPQEARWLTHWGKQDPKTASGNCHLARSLAKWEALR